MGYMISQHGSDFGIWNEVGALRALQRVTTDSQKRFTWFDEGEDPVTLDQYMVGWSWELERDPVDHHNLDHPVTGIYFLGEKAGEGNNILFNTIAPYVKASSWIEMQGEEGERWRWMFNGKTLSTVYASLVWPGE